jgi:hypothetical protein
MGMRMDIRSGIRGSADGPVGGAMDTFVIACRVQRGPLFRGLFPITSRLEYKIDGHSSAGVGLNIEFSNYRLAKTDSVSP